MTAFCMMEPTTHIALNEEALSADTCTALRRTLKKDPVLLAQTRLWASLCERTAESLRRALPPTEDLIAVALFEAGLMMDASEDDLVCVRDVKKALDPLRSEHPAVNALIGRIADDAKAFEAAWSEHAPVKQGPIEHAPKPPQRRLLPVQPAFRWSVAASIAVLAVAALYVLRMPDTMRITVPENDIQRIELADGSSVVLAGPAELSWQENLARRVFLTGNGFFDVAPNGDPFAVTTSHAVTTVTGTEFGVESSPEGTHVTVFTGGVLVRPLSSDNSVALQAGDAAQVAPDASAPPALLSGGAKQLLWTGLFIFRDTPIDSVALALETAFNVDIDVQESLRNETLTGTFDRDQAVDDILSIVAAALGAEIEKEDDRPVYRLVRRSESTR